MALTLILAWHGGFGEGEGGYIQLGLKPCIRCMRSSGASASRMAQKSWSHYERFVILYVCIYCKSMAALDINVWPWFSSFSLNRVMIRIVVSGGVDIWHRSCVTSNSDRYPANCRGASMRPYMIWKCYGQAGGIPLFIHIHHVSCRIQWIVLLFSLGRVFMAGERAPRWGRGSIFVMYIHM